MGPEGMALHNCVLVYLPRRHSHGDVGAVVRDMVKHPQYVELVETLNWNFEGEPPSQYITFPEIEGAWAKRENVDPTPCYHHDVHLVERELAHNLRVCPLPIPLKIAVMCYESIGRVNAFYANQNVYNENAPALFYGTITMMGKRTPIHPAMTRYLVSHEYGHGVQYALERAIGLKADNIEPWYKEQFRPTATSKYGPGNWHTNTGELIANDYRILVAQKETEFWPHEGYARPENIPHLVAFWKNVVQIFERLNENLYPL